MILSSLREGAIILPAVERDMANPAWDAASARILIVRLSPWRDVDISTPHLVLFDEIRLAMKDAFIDFAFMPTAADRKALSSRNLPWFFGRASKKSPRDFDIVMVSNAFALELVNLPYLFTTAGLSTSAAARALLDDQPIVIAGGSNASAMGAVVLEGEERNYPARDAFVDGIFFGEGETAIGTLARILAGVDEEKAATKASRASKKTKASTAKLRLARLKKGAKIQGFWPCLLTKGAQRALAPQRPHTVTKPLVLNGPNASSARLSITSGCPGYCSFCLEGWDRRPYAEADIGRLILEAQELRKRSGAEDLEIYSFNFNTHSRIFDLIFELNRIFRRVSFMSQRLDILVGTRGLMESELAGGKHSFTLGIEGISRTLRAYFRKGLSDATIDACLKMTIRPGVKELKLFYIIAGTETPADLNEFSAFIEGVKRRKDSQSPSTRILVSAGFLVRLPFTPLQYAPLEFDREKLVRLALLLREACERAGLEFRLASDPEESFVDQTLSLAGSSAYRWLEKIPSMGFVYDFSLGEGSWKSLRPYVLGWDAGTAFAEEKTQDYRPPLAFLEDERNFKVLHKHYIEAKRLDDRFSCLGQECSGCGVCADGEEREAMTGHSLVVPPVFRHSEKIEALLAVKASFAPVYLSIDYSEDLADAEPEYRMSWLLRALSASVPGAEKIVFEARELLFSGNAPFNGLFGKGHGRYGRGAVALFGPDAKRTELLLERFESIPSGRALSLAGLKATPAPSVVDIEIALPAENMDILQRVFEAFVVGCKLSHTAKREGKGRLYVFPEGSKARKIVLDARLREMEATAFLSLRVGEKAELSSLLDAIGEGCGLRPTAKVAGWS
ncbi:MAG TPA: radical SAM protein [Rectinemataceae bacterium]|nr:radical SAM protein [Rectinemataceae bacterium]